ncbi:hypothetical protein CWE09_12590 [Aliidiomarina minuta]|uniref:Uncharacterized protein n=1 Tax=Aliidiomarina minuta TaxID=880057 RepID=A0A432W3S3_9GAMM|nr:DUF6694 family lipoprotein [Aliidiomarina minuta]RUO23981.1 hypothetical protein CWE09_12590 [Aliidiomarina minuta]
MNNLYKVLLASIFALALAACSGGEPTLDMTNESAFDSSIQNVMAELDEAEQERFSEALSAIMMDEMMKGMSEGKSEEEIETAMKDRVQGKTANEIIAEAQ